jgi:Domain of unknown function (DUF4232)
MKSLLIAALAASGLVTCACSSQGDHAAPHATVTVTARQTVTAAPQGQSFGGSAPSGSQEISQGGSQGVATVPAACLSRYLGAKVGLAQGTAGSTYVVLDFKNLNNVPCVLYGYPGVSLADGKPVTQIGLAAAENPATPRKVVTLAPGGVANALLQIVHAASYPASVCQPVNADWLQIFPPNQTVPIYLYYSSPTCAKPVQILTVSVVVPGSGG